MAKQVTSETAKGHSKENCHFLKKNYSTKLAIFQKNSQNMKKTAVTTCIRASQQGLTTFHSCSCFLHVFTKIANFSEEK